MPVHSVVHCPECEEPLIRKPGGRCPQCGTDVRDHVLKARHREKRIEQVVAIISTILVLGVSLLVGGCSIAEGVMVYAVAGAVMYGLAKKTFY